MLKTYLENLKKELERQEYFDIESNGVMLSIFVIVKLAVVDFAKAVFFKS